MPTIKNTVNGGLAEVGEADVEPLVATGLWELDKPKATRTTAKPSQKPAGETEPQS